MLHATLSIFAMAFAFARMAWAERSTTNLDVSISQHNTLASEKQRGDGPTALLANNLKQLEVEREQLEKELQSKLLLLAEARRQRADLHGQLVNVSGSLQNAIAQKQWQDVKIAQAIDRLRNVTAQYKLEIGAAHVALACLQGSCHEVAEKDPKASSMSKPVSGASAPGLEDRDAAGNASMAPELQHAGPSEEPGVKDAAVLTTPMATTTSRVLHFTADVEDSIDDSLDTQVPPPTEAPAFTTSVPVPDLTTLQEMLPETSSQAPGTTSEETLPVTTSQAPETTAEEMLSVMSSQALDTAAPTKQTAPHEVKVKVGIKAVLPMNATVQKNPTTVEVVLGGGQGQTPPEVNITAGGGSHAPESKQEVEAVLGKTKDREAPEQDMMTGGRSDIGETAQAPGASAVSDGSPNAAVEGKGQGFEGLWTHMVNETESVEEIRGHTITWSNQNATEFNRTGKAEIDLNLLGHNYTGEMEDGKILWDDGDVWTRVAL